MYQWRRSEFTSPGADGELQTACLAALRVGGDSRLSIDPVRGVDRYLCPPFPEPDLAVLSSCTASPPSRAGFTAAAACYEDIAMGDRRGLPERIEAWRERIVAQILTGLGLDGAPDVLLTASGTDAMQLVSVLLGHESGGRPTTAILPAAAETGSGVPLAAASRFFDVGPRQGAALVGGGETRTVHVALRGDDGVPLPDEAIVAAFRAAVLSAAGRPIVYLSDARDKDGPGGAGRDAARCGCGCGCVPASIVAGRDSPISRPQLARGDHGIEVSRRSGFLGRAAVTEGSICALS